MNANELKKWVIENDIRQKTIESFWQCFENYMVENSDEYYKYFGTFDRDSLVIWMDKVALKIPVFLAVLIIMQELTEKDNSLK